jgi:hypothetical protein
VPDYLFTTGVSLPILLELRYALLDGLGAVPMLRRDLRDADPNLELAEQRTVV